VSSTDTPQNAALPKHLQSEMKKGPQPLFVEEEKG
jgi:hypothetical protein